MTIAAYPTEVMQDKVLSSAYTFEEKQKTICYGEGKYDAQLEIAKAMLGKNCEISLISEVTGLSIEEIEKLKKA